MDNFGGIIFGLLENGEGRNARPHSIMQLISELPSSSKSSVSSYRKKDIYNLRKHLQSNAITRGKLLWGWRIRKNMTYNTYKTLKNILHYYNTGFYIRSQ